MAQSMVRMPALGRKMKHLLGFILQGRDEFGSEPLQADMRPKLLEINKWTTSRVVLDLVKIVGYHPYPCDEMLLMVAAFRYHDPDIVIDLGTHEGKSARVWWELSRRYKRTTFVHTVDILDPKHPEYPGKRLGKFISDTSVVQHIGDSYECASDLIRNDPDSVFLLFLDADHRYESVRRELELLKLIKQGAVLVHDTFYQPDSNYNHGPYLAILDFLTTTKVKQVIHLQTGLPGMSYLAL